MACAIPPCSVVGVLEVFDGRERVRVVFMADPEQAREAGYRMPPAVSRLTKRIYTIAAQQLGLKSPERDPRVRCMTTRESWYHQIDRRGEINALVEW